MSAEICFVLSQFTRLTDRQTDRQMLTGKTVRIQCSAIKMCAGPAFLDHAVELPQTTRHSPMLPSKVKTVKPNSERPTRLNSTQLS